jgi:hypothetical protein
MDLKTFTKKFNQLRDSGYVKSERRGNTGVGHTLEVFLGLNENNIALSDMDVAELKAHRSGSSSLITLFTLDRQAWVMGQMDAIHQFGTLDEEGRPNLYMTLFAERESSSLPLVVTVDKQAATVTHRSGTVVAQWQHAALAERFEQKFPALMLVTADYEMRGSEEWFHYKKAQLLHGTSSAKLELGLKKGWIAIDLRLHDNEGTVRNHGTGFRIQEGKLPELFEEISEI